MKRDCMYTCVHTCVCVCVCKASFMVTECWRLMAGYVTRATGGTGSGGGKAEWYCAADWNTTETG